MESQRIRGWLITRLRFIRAWLSRFNRTPATVIAWKGRINSIGGVTGRRKLVIIEYQITAVSGQLPRACALCAFCMSEISLAAHDKHAIGYSLSVQDTSTREIWLDVTLLSCLRSFFSCLSFSLSLSWTVLGIRMNFGRIACASADLRRGRGEKSKITPEALPFPSTRRVGVTTRLLFDSLTDEQPTRRENRTE